MNQKQISATRQALLTPGGIEWAKVKCFKHVYEMPVRWHPEGGELALCDHEEKGLPKSLKEVGVRKLLLDLSELSNEFLEGSFMALSLTKNHQSVKVKVQPHVWETIQKSPWSLRRLTKKALKHLSQSGRVVPIPAHLNLHEQRQVVPSKKP